jgi:PPOX class probable F420-dependent enzyme
MSRVSEREAFLTSGRYIATLATENEDGSTHLTAVWYLYEEGAFLVPTSGESRKAANVQAHGRAAVMVDARSRGVLRGVQASGTATVVRGRQALELNERIHRRYLTDEGLLHPQLGHPISTSDDVTLRLDPNRWASWDMREYFGELFSAPELVYPLDG